MIKLIIVFLKTIKTSIKIIIKKSWINKFLKNNNYKIYKNNNQSIHKINNKINIIPNKDIKMN